MSEACLQITEVKIKLLEEESNGLLAWASCVVNESLLLDSIAIRRTQEGKLGLSFPEKKSGTGITYPYFRPISRGAREAFEEAILGKLSTIIGGIQK